MKGPPKRKLIGCYARGMRHIFLEEIVHPEECINLMKLELELGSLLNKQKIRKIANDKKMNNPSSQAGYGSGYN